MEDTEVHRARELTLCACGRAASSDTGTLGRDRLGVSSDSDEEEHDDMIELYQEK